jgi:hypothetical protein
MNTAHRSVLAMIPYQLLGSKATQDFCGLFGITADPVKDYLLFKKQCLLADPRYANVDGEPVFQSERQLLPDEKLPEDKVAAVRACAEEMGILASEIPLRGEFDAVISLGAFGASNLGRPEYAAKARATGEADFELMVLACSTRTVTTEKEKAQIADLAPDAERECDICEAARAIIETKYGLTVMVDVTDNPKAGTPDVLNHTFDRLISEGLIPETGARVAVITTIQYALSTDWDAKRVGAEHGIQISVAGMPSKAEKTDLVILTEACRILRAAADAEHALQEEA